MTSNLYFNNYAFHGEQNLIEDLIIESIKIYGMDVQYLPRTIVAEDSFFGEDPLSKFTDAYEMEMYIKQINDLKEENKKLKRIVKQQEAIWFSQENLIQSLLELSNIN